ncbi:AraC family transcriptional regulator [Neorhizobium alkalisoli]|uniref:AraC family transcriptional regulator n=1 Tax=Neorhizobium alkalisoli TaxID=528178 RepID=A0A561R7X4_9HYPH|nr:helix-turn-helix transcriptional regulator [Neorhizobium alkalisoli]TWF58709.1 AraC family transcriptional regulator [Neorhizobium alkalisoli]
MDITEQPALSSSITDRAKLRSLNELHSSDDPVFAHAAHFPVSRQGKVHSHDRAQLVCATTSVVDVMAGERRWTVQPGHAAWLPGGVGHSVSALSDSVFRSFYVRSDIARSLAAQAVVFDLSPLLTGILSRLLEIYDGQGDCGLYPHLAALTLDEIARAEPLPNIVSPRVPLPRDRRLKLICDALIEQPADRRTLEEWGKAAGASARTLERLFREETGMSFNAWRQACRIAAAIPRLELGTPVQLVSWEVGYDSPSAFAAIFRRVMGINPTSVTSRH